MGTQLAIFRETLHMRYSYLLLALLLLLTTITIDYYYYYYLLLLLLLSMQACSTNPSPSPGVMPRRVTQKSFRAAQHTMHVAVRGPARP